MDTAILTTLGARAARHANTAGVDFMSYPGARTFFPAEPGFDAAGTALLRGTRHEGRIFLFADGSWVQWTSRCLTGKAGAMTGSWSAGCVEPGSGRPRPAPFDLSHANGAWRREHAQA